ncbi:hypothetical protein BZG02_19805 [Labilibaculum filiforme]|uniref:Uncharacterized protein n=1 Tax=Labilibaculum filiforme TaxID=1940526 RepID=A0A2N3HQH7_9BACT|nr:tetratricopeptide repeat protein [Labilibaculum filiforme]PKQ60301.1 hypothetical protein BZG02_19805 [Labilibaculum filiforme]
MKLKLILLLVLFTAKYGVFAQEYNISLFQTNKAITLTNEGIENLKSDRWDKAFNLYVEAIAADVTYRNSYLQLYTLAMADSSRIDTVISILQESKKIVQQDDEICYYLGEMYKSKGEENRAMAEFSMAIAFSKMNGEDFRLVPRYYFNRANICLGKNRISTAVLDYTYALNLKPDYGLAFANRGICFFKMGEIEAACKDWKQAVKLGVSQSEEYIDKNCHKEVAQ